MNRVRGNYPSWPEKITALQTHTQLARTGQHIRTHGGTIHVPGCLIGETQPSLYTSAHGQRTVQYRGRGCEEGNKEDCVGENSNLISNIMPSSLPSLCVRFNHSPCCAGSQRNGNGPPHTRRSARTLRILRTGKCQFPEPFTVEGRIPGRAIAGEGVRDKW